MKKNQKNHNPALKGKVALEAVRENETIAQIAHRYQVHPTQVYKWRRFLVENVSRVFDAQEQVASGSLREDELLKKIGELTVERDFLSRGLGPRR